MNKLEQFAERHITLTKTSLRSYLVLSVILAIGSVGFGTLMIEEMVFACSGHHTLLQDLGLNMDGVTKYCSNTEKHSYLTNSLIEIVGAFLYAYVMMGGYFFSKEWLNKHPNNSSKRLTE